VQIEKFNYNKIESESESWLTNPATGPSQKPRSSSACGIAEASMPAKRNNATTSVSTSSDPKESIHQKKQKTGEEGDAESEIRDLVKSQKNGSKGSIMSFFGKTPKRPGVTEGEPRKSEEDNPVASTGSAQKTNQIINLDDDDIMSTETVTPSATAIELSEGGRIVPALSMKLKPHQVRSGSHVTHFFRTMLSQSFDVHLTTFHTPCA
jgi:hypothetical protein